MKKILRAKKKLDTFKKSELGGENMKLIFATLAGLVVVTSLMYAVVSIVIGSEIAQGLIVGSMGIGVLVGHLHMTDPPKFEDDEDLE